MINFENIKRIISNGRVGFQIDEIMTGTHQFIPGKGPLGEHPMEFRVTWGHKDLSKWINPFNDEFMLSSLNGKVDVGGLVVNADCTGTLALRYVQEQKIRYLFEFSDDSGKKYQFSGEKRNLRPWNLHQTHVKCFGEITEMETGEVILESITYFDLSNILKFLMSFKIL